MLKETQTAVYLNNACIQKHTGETYIKLTKETGETSRGRDTACVDKLVEVLEEQEEGS